MKFKVIICAIFQVVFWPHLAKCQDDDEAKEERVYRYGPVIDTSSGMVRGFEDTTSHGKKVMAYFGIPFAEPPTGKRRYMPTIPVNRRSGVLDATKLPNICQQIEYPGTSFIPALRKWAFLANVSEDCLYLNIWAPIPKRGDDRKLSEQNKTVMIWIYGGGFSKGSISFPQYNGSGIAVDENVILVAINYRLGAFGYLYLDHPSIPGNGGLHDQMTAIKWIHENIREFGGNPNNMAVFGESAGAASAGLLLISPSNHYFKRAILQSGSATTPWASLNKKEAMGRALEIAKAVGCPYKLSNKEAIVNCLLQAKPEALLEAEPSVPDGLAFSPIVDGGILPREPIELLKEIKGKDYDILLGTNTNEGTLFFLFLLPEVFDFFSETAFMSREVLSTTLNEYSPFKSQEAIDAIEFFYVEWANKYGSDKNISYQDNFDALVGDYFFVCRNYDTANAIMEAGGKSYVYHYEHRSSHSFFPAWLGVFHSHEIQYIFGDPLYRGAQYTDDERIFSRKLIRMWANFAKYGDPNGARDSYDPLLEDTVKWPKWTEANHDYVHLSAKSISADKNFRRKECNFIDHYIPQLYNRTKQLHQTIGFYKAYVDSIRNSDSENNLSGRQPRLFYRGNVK